ncbi:MAG: heavy metal translocating P-type ATPase [Clostridia bacterium]|nr:heavy metal translocating P-type ATPase [Clostridia bacterium]
MRLHYEIKGMNCAACVSHVERAIRSVLSEKDTVTVSLLTNSVSILLSEDPENPAALTERLSAAVKANGYTLVTGEEKNEKQSSEAKKRITRLILSAVFTLAVMYLSMGSMIGIPPPPFLSGVENGLWMALAQLALTVPVLVINRRFFTGGFRALFHLSPNMDSLIAVGAGASVLYGLFAIVMIGTATEQTVIHSYLHDLYFESAAMILTLVSLGKLLESGAKDKAFDAVRSLSTLSPKYALVKRDGKEISVPTEELLVGDLILVRAGELIPVDGVVVDGTGSADESALTGESMPVEKEKDSSVRAACVLLSGALTVRATQVGKNTSLSRIITLLEDAAASKAPIARIADRVSSVFVPCVMGISLVTLAVWLIATGNGEQALRSAISVLVISCPCALGLATPTAITVGVGRGARMGILFRSAEALEKLSGVKTVLFDKTGPLTEGKPALTDVYTYGESYERVLSLASSVERLSSHPLALSVTVGAERLGLTERFDVENFASLTGVGAEGMVDGVLCRIGKPRGEQFAMNNHCAKDERIENEPENKETISNINLFSYPSAACVQRNFEGLEQQGKTAVLVTFNSRPVAVLGIADRIREDTKIATEALKSAHVRCFMLTGDNERTAQAIAKEANLDGFSASLLPEDKAKIVKEASQKEPTAMVGDGINDAPALISADVGIAVGAGTEIAIDCAGVVLSKASLSGVADAYFLSRAAIRIIKQNLFWALFYNAVCIPVAAGVFFPVFGWQLSPMLASAAMSFSSVCVVTNALRLRSINLRKGENEAMFFKKEIVKYTLSVEGMMCQRCQAHVKNALEGVKGVKAVEVSLDDKTATVEAVSTVSVASLVAAVTKAGYEAKEK